MPLIDGLKASNENALRKAFELFQVPLYRYIYDKTRSPELAKEVVQLTFIKLWKYRQSLQNDITLSSVLFRIARTIMIDEIRKQKALRKAELNESRSQQWELVSESVSYNDTLRKLEMLIRQMPPVRQRVFRLSRLNCYSYNEIAQMLSISTKTVENHINLALKFIKPFFPVLVLFNTILFIH
ncbi:MAG: RNA polymerase sigma factor [Pseudobacter sp.]|uniref:RNA polymerase sigma factor n=1 Tax=Pseudobacter sp. TaxID=2045420 RepID=UPI003F7D5987